MREFNAFQFVVFLVALPSIIAWLSTSPFWWASALFWLAVVVLFCMSVYATGAVAESFKGSR